MKNDHELVTLIRDKDSMEAFDLLFRKYYPPSVALAASIIADVDFARDLAQDIFLKLWLNRAKLNPEKSVRGLILTSIRNASIDYLKSKRTTILSVVDTISEPRSESTAGEILKNELRGEVDRLIGEMPPVRQKVFLMSREQGMDRNSIAKELNISPRTVDKHLELALKNFRKKLS